MSETEREREEDLAVEDEAAVEVRGGALSDGNGGLIANEASDGNGGLIAN